LVLCLAAIGLAVLGLRVPVRSSHESALVAQEPEHSRVQVVSVPLPLQGADADRIRSQVLKAAEQLTKDSKRRPLLILEFNAQDFSAGETTTFASALSLAMALTSEELAGVRTIAFLPQSVRGHGVLPVIACDEIIMSPQAEFGAAGVHEAEISQVVRSGYEDIAERRRTVPKSVALALLDRRQELLSVQTTEGTRLILGSELPELERTTTIAAKTTIKPAGDLGSFTGTTWRHKLGFASHLANDRRELASVLGLPETELNENPLAGRSVKALQVNVTGVLNHRLTQRTNKILDDYLKDPAFNLVVLNISASSDSLEEAVSLAERIHAIDSSTTRTVAYISGEAREGAVIVALACDELVMQSDARLGGRGQRVPESEFAEVRQRVEAALEGRRGSWSAALAIAGHRQALRLCTRKTSGEQRLMSDAELAQRNDRDDWEIAANAIDVSEGIDAELAQSLGLAQHSARTIAELKSLYAIEQEFEQGEINWAMQFIEGLSDPRLSALLLFIGTFALFSELSSPGLGIPGFIAAVCFLLFFWANFLHGTATVLELLLFVAPGTMVFGVGGALMIVASIVLASQTFVLPVNAYQLQQQASSLLVVAAAGVGGVIGIIVLQRFLPHTPYFKRLILQPPAAEELTGVSQRESQSNFDWLLGKRGVALTPLVPSGKVQFGDEVVDVISDGTLVEPGRTVMVIEALGHRVKVRPVDA
jgi:membrane-bound ClpP family serine protease